MNVKAGGLFVGAFLLVAAGQAMFGFIDNEVEVGGSEQVTLTSGESRTRGKVVVPTVNGSTYNGGTYNRSGRASSEQIDGWISEALVVMKRQGIPGTRAGIKRIMNNESGGDPTVCNGNDINARNGVPSCGLMQVIPTTFQAHHCEGTSWNLTDPVANICASAHYAWKRYKSIDFAPTPY